MFRKAGHSKAKYFIAIRVFFSIFATFYSRAAVLTNSAPLNGQTNLSATVDLKFGASPLLTGRVFNVFAAANQAPGTNDLQGSTTNNSWRLTNLLPAQNYFWKIEAMDGLTNAVSPVWQFATAPLGTSDHFDWSISSPNYTNRVSSASLRAVDVNGFTVPNFGESVPVSATGSGLAPARVVISEVNIQTRQVEFANVSGSSINMGGWTVTVFDKASWPNPLRTLALPQNAAISSGSLFTLASGLSAPGSFPSLVLGSNINWGSLVSDPAAVLLQDTNGAIVDFVALGGARAEQITAPMAIPATQWAGLAVPRRAETFFSYHRIGNSDSNDASDWTYNSSSIGSRNPAMSALFLPGRGALPMQAEVVANFIGGIAAVKFQIATANPSAQLIGIDSQGRWALSPKFAVESAPPLQLILPQFVRERAAVAEVARAVLPEIAAEDVTIFLQASDPTEVDLPDRMIVAKGASNVVFNVSAKDDGVLDGTQIIQIIASAASFENATNSLASYDAQTAQLSLVGPISLNETGGVGQATLTVSGPVAKTVDIALSASPTNQLQFPASVRIASGATGATFPVTAVQDLLLEGPTQAQLTASMENWSSGSATIEILDDERAELSLTIPSQFDEGGGTRASAATLSVGGILLSNLIVQLTSSDTNSLTIPATVTIPAGKSNVAFNVTLIENSIPQPNSRPVTITAESAGFKSATAATAILDNDPAEIRFSAVSSPQYTDHPVSLILTAYGIDGQFQSNFKGTVTLQASNSQGAVALNTNLVGPFVGGSWNGSITVLNPATLVRLRSSPYPGESEPFHVEPPAIRIMPFLPTDIAVDPATHTLFATTLANNASFPQKIVAIDPITLSATNSYSLSIEPSTVEVAPQGGFAYILSSDRKTFERFNFDTRTTSTKFTVPANIVATDFAVVGANPDSIVVRFSDTTGGNSAGIWLYNQGFGTKIPTLSNIDPYWLETDAAGTIYGYQPNNNYPLVLYGAGYLAVNQVLHGGQFWLRSGVLYDSAGYAASASNLQLLGVYPNVVGFLESAYAEVDPVSKRTLFLAGKFLGQIGNTRILAYDTDSFSQVGQLPLPGLASAPLRFLRMDNHRLVFVNSSGQIWFIESSQLQPPAPADIGVEQRLVSAEMSLDQPASITITLTNKGPALATLIHVTNSLPQGARYLSGVASTGVVVGLTNAFDWRVPALPPGESASLTFTVSFSIAGLLTNGISAIDYEGDQSFANNIATLPLYVTIPAQGDGAFLVKYPVNDLLYEPLQNKLFVAVPAQPNSLPKGIGILDPNTAAQTAFQSLTQEPYLMSRTSGGEYLYVSFKDATRVGRLQLPSFAQDLSFGVGSESPYAGTVYSFYAGAIEPLPSDPNSVVVWEVRAPYPTAGEFPRGITLYRSGVAQPKFIELTSAASECFQWKSSGNELSGNELFSWHWGSDPFGGAIRTLNRYDIAADGITLLESSSPLARELGSEIKPAGPNRFINTAGREISLQPFGIAGTYGGAESAVAAVVDTNAARTFFIVPSGAQWALRAYNLSTREPIGAIALPNLIGTPTDLTLWSSNGLAFRASTNQIGIVRTALRRPNLNADLAVSAIVSGPGQITIAVTNKGPADAQQVLLKNQLPSGSEFESGGVTQGSFNQQNAEWSIGGLAAGATARLTLRVAGTGATLTDTVTVSGASSDAVQQNNTAQATVQFSNQSFVEQPLVLSDLAWSSSVNRLIGSVADGNGNWSGSLVTVDPGTLETRQEVFAGSKLTKMDLSSDGSRLLVGMDNAVRVIGLPDFSSQRYVPLDSAGTPFSGADLKVLPGSNDSFVVRRANSASGDLRIFDGLASRSNSVDAIVQGGGLEVGGDPMRVFFHPANSIGFTRYAISSGGLSLIDSDPTLLPTITQLDLAWANGRLIASDGTYFDPNTRVKLGKFANVPGASRIVYDSGSDRIFFAFKQSTNMLFRCFDVPTQSLIGEEKYPTTLGDPQNLVRWGESGLAFNATNGLGIARTQLIPFAAPADLSVGINGPATNALFGQTYIFHVAITNSGPNPAANLRLLGTISASAGDIIVDFPAGATNFTAGGVVNVNLGSLPAGGVTTLNIRAHPASSGAMTLSLKITSDAIDPNLLDNAQTISRSIDRPVTRGDAFVVNEQASDIVYDSTRDRLYASSPSGAISVINPNTTARQDSWPLPATPKLLALSDDNSQLYIGAGNGQILVRVDPATGSPNLQIDLGPYTLQDIQLLPGRSHSALISQRIDFNFYRVALYDDAQARAGEFVDSAGAASLEFGNSPDVVYGIGKSLSGPDRFRTIQIDTNGVHEISFADPFQYNVGEIHFAKGFLYSDSGLVIDPPSNAIAAVVGNIAQGSKVLPDPSSGRVLYFVKSGSGWELRSYDIHTLAFIARGSLPSTTAGPARLARWGIDGIAYATTNNELVVARSLLLPGGPASDAALSIKTTNQFLVSGAILPVTLTITNQGANEIGSGLLSIQFPISAIYQGDLGILLPAGSNLITIPISNLPAGGSLSYTLHFQPTHAGPFEVAASLVTSCVESNIDNNFVRFTPNVQYGLAADQFAIVELASSNCVYEPISGLIYALGSDGSSAARGKVFSLDPRFGQIRTVAELAPGLMQAAVSEDGARLYVLGGKGSRIDSVQLPSGTVGPSIDLAALARVGFEIQVVPGSNNKLAVVLDSLNIGLFEDGILKPQLGMWMRHLAFYSPTDALGFDPRSVPTIAGHVSVLTNGIEASSNWARDVVDGDMVSAGGLVYTSGGSVFDPVTITKLRGYGVTGPVAPIPSANRVAFLTQTNICVFQTATNSAVGFVPLPPLKSSGAQLLYAGADRLAIRTDSGEFAILRTRTLPFSPADSDNDGLPDDWEIAFGLDKSNPADAKEDFDSDGSNNLAEYLAATNPLNPNSVLKLQLTVSSNTATVTFPRASGISYRLQSSPGAVGPWTTITNTTAPTESMFSIQAPTQQTGSSALYRVVIF